MNIRQMKAALYARIAINRVKFPASKVQVVPSALARVIGKPLATATAAKPVLSLVAAPVAVAAAAQPAIAAKPAAPVRRIVSIRIDRMPEELIVPIGTTVKIVIPRASQRIQEHLFNMSPKDGGFFDGQVQRLVNGLPQSPIKMAAKPAQGVANGSQIFKDVFIPRGTEAGTTEIWFRTTDGANERFPKVNRDRTEGFGNTLKIRYV